MTIDAIYRLDRWTVMNVYLRPRDKNDRLASYDLRPRPQPSFRDFMREHHRKRGPFTAAEIERLIDEQTARDLATVEKVKAAGRKRRAGKVAQIRPTVSKRKGKR